MQTILSHISLAILPGGSEQAGRRAVGLDLELGSKKRNMATDLGFSNCLFQTCCLREGAAALVAPVCGSWVFLKLGGLIQKMCFHYIVDAPCYYASAPL